MRIQKVVNKMALTLKQILLETREKYGAVYRGDNHVLFEAVLAQAEEENKPVILMIRGSFSRLDAAFDYARQRIQLSSVPVCLHLDHAAS